MSIYSTLGIDPSQVTYLSLKYGEPTDAQWFEAADPAIISNTIIALRGNATYNYLLQINTGLPEYLYYECYMTRATSAATRVLARVIYNMDNNQNDD